jgi:hypothetical protein
MIGYRDLERLAVCTNTSPNMVVPFAMLECSAFSDRNGPDRGHAKKLPIEMDSDRMTSRAPGFASIEPLRAPRKMRSDAVEVKTVSIRREIN